MTTTIYLVDSRDFRLRTLWEKNILAQRPDATGKVTGVSRTEFSDGAAAINAVDTKYLTARFNNDQLGKYALGRLEQKMRRANFSLDMVRAITAP